MWIRNRRLIELCAPVLVACSGLEPAPCDCPGPGPACSVSKTNPVGVDDPTPPFGTPREVLAAATANSQRAANFVWYASDGSSSYVDTTVVLSLSGSATAARFGAQGDCPATLDIDGALFDFQTADGAFDESVPGTLELTRGDWLAGPGQSTGTTSFSGEVTTLAGSYDLARVAQQFAEPRVSLTLSFSPLSGLIEVSEADPSRGVRAPVKIASWGGGTGLAGSGAGGAAATGGEAGSADAAGNGGITSE